MQQTKMRSTPGAATPLRRLARLSGVVWSALLVSTCSDGGTRPLLVGVVDVTAPAPSIAVYRSLQLGVTVRDTKGSPLTGRTVTWSSSSDAVATVSAAGLVSGIAAGTVTITARSEGRSGSVPLTVSPAVIDTVTLTPDTATVAQGATRALTVTLKDERGATLTGRTVDWTSGSTTVAEVSGSGVVTGRNAGIATITATAEGKSATATVTVQDSVASVAISPDTATLDQGRSRTLAAAVRNGSGAVLTGRTVTWASSNAAVAYVYPSGLVTALTAGTATITATVEGKTGVATVTVRDSIASVVVTPGDVALAQGDTATLAASVRNAAGAALTGRTVTWTTSDAGVATVSSTGLVSALAAGTATITAAAEAKAGTAVVSVGTGGGPIIQAISPGTLVPGASATISGIRFGAAPADNAVTIGGVTAVVTAASPTQLQVTVPCVPSGAVPVVVTAASGATPAYTHPLQVSSQHTLAVGQAAVVTDGTRIACNEIAATGVQSQYVLAVYNTTASPTALADYQLSGITSGTAAGVATFDVGPSARVARRSPSIRRPADLEESGLAAQSTHDESHYRLLEKNQQAYRQLWQRYGHAAHARAGAAADAAQLATVTPPLTQTIRVSNINASSICTTYFTINATRIYYSGKLAIYEDDATPAALKAANNSAMAAYYQQIGDQFNADMEPIIRTNFGDVLRRDALTDNNGVLMAVFTPVINNELPGYAGFVVSCDQFPNGAGNTASNFGEYFYAYQPTVADTGYYNKFTPHAWYRSIRGTFIHETKHVASFAARMANYSPVWEESWLEESTARHSEELWARQSLYSVAWKGNTGYGSAADPSSIYCDVRPLTTACNNANPRRPALGMWRHFATLYGFLGNSSMLSPFGRSANDDAAYFYSVSWSLVRYAIDRHATTEASFLTSLTQSTTNGTANLSGSAGVSTAELLGRWALALYADDLAGIGASAELQIPSWNVPHIYAGLKTDYPSDYPRARPLVTTPLSFGTIAPTNYTALVGGGIDYFELSGVHAAAQVLRIGSTSGGDPAAALRIAILRVQ